MFICYIVVHIHSYMYDFIYIYIVIDSRYDIHCSLYMYMLVYECMYIYINCFVYMYVYTLMDTPSFIDIWYHIQSYTFIHITCAYIYISTHFIEIWI